MDDISYVPVKTYEYKAIEQIVEFSRNKVSPSGKVETERDWAVVIALFEFWKSARPDEYKSWQQVVKGYREAYKDNRHGSAEDKGGASVQHLSEIPPTFYKLMHGEAFYPNQDFNRDFIRKLIDYIPDFKMHTSSKI